MALAIGTQLGSLEVTALIGRGGMGEVYRARDTKLKRDVAIKILPEEFSRDADRVSRFQREAEVLAALNHPNIAAIYDLQEANGSRYLVLELVEGETLADRIAHGPIPVEEALDIAKNICEALEAAHEKGIIHRDLKPANVKITPESKVKVLDFGLAKAMAVTAPATTLSNSPTLVTGTMGGAIIGTAAYMSPEQGRGRNVDKRTDIWGFGCVLYELLTGKQAFHGDDAQEILAAVLKAEPDWALLPATTVPSIRTLLRRCLQKDLTQRLRDATDVRIEIQDALNAPASATPWAAAQPVRRLWQRAIPWAAGLVACLLTGLAVWGVKPTSAPVPVSRSAITMSQGERLTGLEQPAVALSPDGTRLVYVASDSTGTQRLYLRLMDSFQARPLMGTEDASGPFFSPDGQWIGFFAGPVLKKIAVSAGATLRLASLPSPLAGGASWGTNDTIVVSFGTGAAGLWRGPASGGQFQEFTAVKEGEVSHRWPEFLPGGKAVLFTILTGATPMDSEIAIQRLDTGERKILVRGGGYGRYASSGHLVYYQAATMMAVPFDLARLEVTGTPIPVLEGIMSSTTGSGVTVQYSLSRSGSLVYVPGSGPQADLTLALVDRKRMPQSLPAPPRPYSSPLLSPDGRLAAVRIGSDVWIYDLNRDTLTRLTFEGRNDFPRWTPDGKRVVYSSDRNGTQSILGRFADGSGPEDRLFSGTGLPRVGAFTPDGRSLIYVANNPKTAQDIWVLPLEGAEARKPRAFLQTPFVELTPELSPDGRWLAYVSNESGRFEIYVRPFPDPGGKWQISTEGGQGLKWSPKGNELFYRTGSSNEKMMAVDIQTQPTFSAGKPHLLFETPKVAFLPLAGIGADYSVSPDGQHFLMVRAREQPQAPTQINVVLNWLEELKQRVLVR